MDGDSNRTRDAHWRTLMRAAQDGDSGAYAQLLSEILPLLRGVAARKWPGDADDIVQDILISLHAVRHSYDPGRAFMPWLMTIASRRIADAARRNYARAAVETTVEVMPDTFDGDATKTEQEKSDDEEAVRRALAALSSGQRHAVELLKLKGLSLEEASVATGKSVASLKVTVHRALKAMRQTLEAPVQQ